MLGLLSHSLPSREVLRRPVQRHPFSFFAHLIYLNIFEAKFLRIMSYRGNYLVKAVTGKECQATHVAGCVYCT